MKILFFIAALIFSATVSDAISQVPSPTPDQDAKPAAVSTPAPDSNNSSYVRPDGKTVVLEALVFKRLPDVKPQHQNPAIGAWTHRSAHYTTANSNEQPVTTANSNEQPVPAPGARRFLLITPTHWMRMDHNNEKFESVSYGTYLYKQDSVVSTLLYASFPHKSGEMHRFRQRVDGGKVELISTGLSPRGEPATFYDILEKLD